MARPKPRNSRNPAARPARSLPIKGSLGIGVALLLALAACSPAPFSSPQATPIPSEWVSYLGDYSSDRDTIYLRENDGRFEAVIKRVPQPLRQVAGDTFANGDGRLIFASDRLQHQGTVYYKRAYAQGTFRITPLRPVEELRASALAASPPAQPDTLLASDLVELSALDASIRYDIRYATTNNFMGAVFYSSAHAFMQRPAADAVARAHRRLKPLGYGLLIHDAYRPWYVTKMFWDATPDSLRNFVADPRAGSRHNRGAAVDLTLYNLKTGAPIQMPGGYDEFSERSYPDYPGGTSRQRAQRDLLRRVMEAEGFRVYDFEWWHFDYGDWRRYPIGNRTFEQLTKNE